MIATDAQQHSVCATSSVRIHEVVNTNWKKTDLTWDGFGINIWSTVESCCAIIAACLPTLRPLISRARALTSGSWNKVSGTDSTPKDLQPFLVPASQTNPDRKTPNESIVHRQDLEEGQVAHIMEEAATDVRHDAYEMKSVRRGDRSPHPVVRSPRFQQERLVAPLPSFRQLAKSRIR